MPASPHIPYATTLLSPQDASHLRILSICHYVCGGLTLLFGFLPIIHITLGIMAINGQFPMAPGQPPLPPWFGYIFVAGGVFGCLFLWTLGALLISAGRCLAAFKHHLFIVVVSAIACIMFPIGTALGIFTLLVITRENVRTAFHGQHSPYSPTPPA